jgi:kynureninase
MTHPLRSHCVELDAHDPLAGLREHFELPDGVVYLDGNSLGALPRATAARVDQVVRQEWGEGLIRSWNSAGWIDLAQRIGDKVATLIGAGAGQVGVGDSTSVNLYKVLHSAVQLLGAIDPPRRVIVSERRNFPTDLYIAESVAQAHGWRLQLLDAAQELALPDTPIGVVMLTHVNYRTGRMHDMAGLTQAAHAAGALVVWDLAHSAGAVPLDLTGCDADFAVGCGYKYLNGGPGAPAFVWVHPRHTARMDREGLRQPLSGWLGHAAPFEFHSHYAPAGGIRRYTCGTPALLSMAALECGLDVFDAARAHGGMAALRAKSVALSTLFIECVQTRCAGHGLELVTPHEAAQRGSQVSFAHPQGHAIMQALIERGVIGDFRAGDPGAAAAAAGDLLRFGFTPLYTRYVDVWDACEALAVILETDLWRDARFAQRHPVT